MFCFIIDGDLYKSTGWVMNYNNADDKILDDAAQPKLLRFVQFSAEGLVTIVDAPTNHTANTAVGETDFVSLIADIASNKDTYFFKQLQLRDATIGSAGQNAADVFSVSADSADYLRLTLDTSKIQQLGHLNDLYVSGASDFHDLSTFHANVLFKDTKSLTFEAAAAAGSQPTVIDNQMLKMGGAMQMRVRVIDLSAETAASVDNVIAADDTVVVVKSNNVDITGAEVIHKIALPAADREGRVIRITHICSNDKYRVDIVNGATDAVNIEESSIAENESFLHTPLGQYDHAAFLCAGGQWWHL
jgi:hypothetical protein